MLKLILFFRFINYCFYKLFYYWFSFYISCKMFLFTLCWKNHLDLSHSVGIFLYYLVHCESPHFKFTLAKTGAGNFDLNILINIFITFFYITFISNNISSAFPCIDPRYSEVFSKFKSYAGKSWHYEQMAALDSNVGCCYTVSQQCRPNWMRHWGT